MIRRGALSLTLALFTLALQAAAAGHSPVLHEEPVSPCHDLGAHFCAEVVEHETGPCFLCQVSLNGVFLDLQTSAPVALQTEPLAADLRPEAASEFLLSSHAPRGPPVV